MDFQPSRVGYGFHPTDEELVGYYLRLKMHGGYEQDVSLIEEVNVCDYEPWALPVTSTRIVTGLIGKLKVDSGKSQARIVQSMLKPPRSILLPRKSLVFYKGSVSNGVRTNWIMHEYHPTFSFHNQREFVLCKLKKDPEAIMPAYDEGEASSNVTSHHLENQNSNEYTHPQNFGEGGYGAPMPSYFTANEQDDYSYEMQLHLNSFRDDDGTGDYNLDAALQYPYGNM
ncbi:putative proteinC DOMAIN-CONTAINING PROTEIN 82-RELATED [Salix koriyanagi]|uniref:NAC domain-containing protein n=1 Tax=Salix koriyanagi TaxID=2511006 RepID=A0A9Q0U4F3_9ROSI|nr:putative proteinC DOMAIN-CONTAINING PROTEIN 82-RELATED [Salix koriyanagi]